MNSIEVRSNVFGDIMKIRKGVIYKNTVAVIDELLQNCQRAKATVILTSLSGPALTVEDDGIGCKDPQSFFEKSTSGWDGIDEAFGEGFFSVFLLADLVVVESNDWKVTIDVLKMLETREALFEVEQIPQRQGTKIHLEGPKIEEARWHLYQEIEAVGSVLSQQVYYNGNLLAHKDILEVPRAQYPETVVHFDNEFYEANLYPHTSYSDTYLIYEGRPVCEVYAASRLAGKMVIKPGMLTLRAPDRKDVVSDAKYSAFITQVRKDAKEVFRNFLRVCDDKMLNDYESGVSEHLEPSEYVNLLKFDSSMYYVPERDKDGGEQKPVSINLAMPLEPVIPREVMLAFSEQLKVPTEKLKILAKEEGGLAKLAGQSGLFWVLPDVLKEALPHIQKAEYYGAKIIIAKNRLYSNALSFLGIPSIGEHDEDIISLSFACKEMDALTAKQKAVLEILSKLAVKLNLPEDVFQFANIMGSAKYREADTAFNTFRANGFTDRQKIYLDVSNVKWYSEKRSKLANYKVFTQIIGTVAHELAHYCHGTVDGTAFHYEMEKQYFRYIGEALCEMED